MWKTYLKDQDWSNIYCKLKDIKTIRVDDEYATRRFFEGVYFILRTGSQWRELPPCYGKWRSVHKRYKQWCDKKIFTNLLEYFAQECDLEYTMIDATIIRAHPCAAGYVKNQADLHALGRSRGGFTTKIHAVVDALGLPLRFSLTSGHRHEVTQAADLLRNIQDSYVIADKAYASEDLATQLVRQRCSPVIPSPSTRKSPRAYDRHLYKERHLIEAFFSKIKHFRRVFSRFDKSASSFLGFLLYASIILWLR